MIYSAIARLVKVLVKVLSYEASRYMRTANHAYVKRRNHALAEDKAVTEMRKAGMVYRTSLSQKADAHERHADKASALASKLNELI